MTHGGSFPSGTFADRVLPLRYCASCGRRWSIDPATAAIVSHICYTEVWLGFVVVWWCFNIVFLWVWVGISA